MIAHVIIVERLFDHHQAVGIEPGEMDRIAELVRRVGIHHQRNRAEARAHGVNRIKVPPRLDLDLDALVARFPFDGDALEQLFEKIATELAAGYQRIKIKIKPGWDVDVVSAVRERFGPVPLMVDANAAYTSADADHLAALDRYGLMMIEQPLDYDDIGDHAVLQRQLKTPLCLDESIKSVNVAREAIAAGACRIINIKPGRVGGFSESIRLHDLCAAHGIPVWHGGMLESGIGRAANIHLSTLPNFSLPGDIAASKRYFDPDLIDPPIEVAADGTIAVPQGPGLGVSICEDRIERATLRHGTLRKSEGGSLKHDVTSEVGSLKGAAGPKAQV